MSPPAPRPDDRHLRTARWPWVGAAGLIVFFVCVVLWIIFKPTPNVWTDDAYVQVHYAMISPRISGQISKLAVTDNQSVKTGDLLVQLDDQDERVALQQAQAQLANTQAMTARQPAMIDQAKAQVAALQADIVLSEDNKKRFDELANTGAGSIQQRQQADATLAAQQAQLAAARAAVEAAQGQMNVLLAAEKAAEANVAQAALNLSYAQIKAPFDGMVDALSSQVGDYITQGQTLMTLVPLRQLYIIANYRETALRHVRPGQTVSIHVDAYNIDLKGVVEGLPPTTGAVYSPIPPDNATGNFTKIVQRLPVKIILLPGQNLANLLRAGLSVETTIHTGLEDVVLLQRRSQSPVIMTLDQSK